MKNHIFKHQFSTGETTRLEMDMMEVAEVEDYFGRIEWNPEPADQGKIRDEFTGWLHEINQIIAEEFKMPYKFKMTTGDREKIIFEYRPGKPKKVLRVEYYPENND